MAVSSVTATNAATGDTATTTTSRKNSVDSQMFLQLLVAQLRNQDPMNPADSQQMMGQMAQLQSVDQLTTISKAMQAQQEMDALTQSLLLMGKTVEYTDSTGEQTLSGVVSGVKFDQGLPTLVVGGQDVLPGDVVAVSQSTS
jgi:flagellar basal-body rod modification protein FlgD